MKSILALVVLLGGSAIGATHSISDAELSLGGVALGDTESQVLAVLGPAPHQADTSEGLALQYARFTVVVGWLEQQAPGKERRVVQLTSTSPTICTPSKMCPGESISTIVASHGQPISAKLESGNFLEYYSSQSSCWLQLSTSGNTISAISAVCAP